LHRLHRVARAAGGVAFPDRRRPGPGAPQAGAGGRAHPRDRRPDRHAAHRPGRLTPDESSRPPRGRGPLQDSHRRGFRRTITVERQARKTFAHTDDAPTEARRFARECLRAWDFPGLEMPVLLAVSELATNAVLHGSGPIEVAMDATTDRLRVTVSDE